jgi:hypothetical protein
MASEQNHAVHVEYRPGLRRSQRFEGSAHPSRILGAYFAPQPAGSQVRAKRPVLAFELEAFEGVLDPGMEHE